MEYKPLPAIGQAYSDMTAVLDSSWVSEFHAVGWRVVAKKESTVNSIRKLVFVSGPWRKTKRGAINIWNKAILQQEGQADND